VPGSGVVGRKKLRLDKLETAWQRSRPALIAAVTLILVFGATPVAAHDDRAISPANWGSAWNWDWLILAGLALTGAFYLRGVRLLWRHGRLGRGVAVWQVFAFSGGLAILFVSLISPLDALSGALLTAHMVQHMLLIMVAAPLLVLGGAPLALLWGLPPNARSLLGRWCRRQGLLRLLWHALTRPLVVWFLHVFALWFWHMPPFYQETLTHKWLHGLEHASFFGTALLFWRLVVHAGAFRQMSQGAAVLFIFAMALQGGLLGWLLTFSETVWYPAYAATAPAWGLTVLEDQQLAGTIMWIPSGIIYAVAALTLLGLWLYGLEQQDMLDRKHLRQQQERDTPVPPQKQQERGTPVPPQKRAAPSLPARYLLVALVLALLLATAACRPQVRTPAEQQWARGERLYGRFCSECHDPGRIGPVITQPDLLHYDTAGALFDYNRRTMPPDAPGRLSQQEYWDISAHMLRRHRLLPADVVVGPETAEVINIARRP
jgi:putative membrane protein